MSHRLLPYAKQMRHAPTDAEAKLWRQLRAHRFVNWKFKRQQPSGHYIVDFVCFSRRLILESTVDSTANSVRMTTNALNG